MPDPSLKLYPSRTNEHPARTLLHIHGRVLIGASRSTSSGPIKRYTSQGFTVFSIDYRLAPETKLPEIIEDFQDALEWVRTEGTKIGNTDPNRLAVTGGLASGRLTLMTGTFLLVQLVRH